MKRNILAFIGLCLTLLLVVACGRQVPVTPDPATPTPRPTHTPPPPRPVIPYTPVPADTLSPIIIQREPRRGEALRPDGSIEIVFDKAMDQDAVANALSVQAAGETPSAISGDLTWRDDRTVSFKPTQALARDVVYDVILTQDAVARSGEPLREPFTFRFTTAGYLEVAQVMPAPASRDIETDATITVIFNRPVVPLTALRQMEDFPDPLTFDPPVAGQGEWLNTSIYAFTPDAPLPGGTTLTARVAAGLEDVAGAALVEEYTWQFTTERPQVVWTSPRDQAELVDINTAIRVEFNQPIDLDSARRAFNMRGRRAVQGDFAIEGHTLVFTPTQALSFDTQYTVNIDTGITAVAGGQGMREAFRWRFTTVPLPEIVATRPAHREREAYPHTAFEIIFNTRIDPTTVMDNLSATPPLSPTQVYTSFSRYNNTFTLRFGAQPSTEYTFVIDAGIADPYGNTIPRGREVSFRTAPLDPAYRLGVPDTIGTYDAAQPAQLLVEHVNLSRLDLELHRLPLSAIESNYWDWDTRLPSGSELMRSWQVTLDSPLNERAHALIDLAQTADNTLAPGLYVLRATSPDLDRNDYARRQFHVMVVSDLNLTLKRGPESLFLWATDLASGEPVPGLTLNIIERGNDRFRERVTTDADGVAQFPDSQDRNALLAYAEAPFVAVSEHWGQRDISPWAFGMGQGARARDYRAYIYTDRPIYRPDQTVYFKGVVRADDDALYSLPRVREIEVFIRDANYTEIYHERLTLSDLGTFEGEVTLERGTGLGQYAIVANFDGHYIEAAFQVAAYRPPEFEVTLDLDAAEVSRGDDVAATLRASYFFGGPLADATLEWHAMAQPYTFAPPWGGRYSYNDVDDPFICLRCWWWEPPAPQAILSGVGTTDAAGEFALTLPGAELDEAMQRGAQRVTLEGSVVGPDNQHISGRSSVIVHPGPYYIGLSPQEYVGRAGQERAIDLVAVDWAGARLPNTAVQVEFYRVKWVNTFVPNDYGGGSWTWDTERTLVAEVVVTTNRLGEAVAAFTPDEGGSYHVVATPANPTAATERIRSSIFVWVSGADHISWRRENHDRITLISDRTEYQVGDVAEILIPSPFEAPHKALVTVEREGVRRHEVITLESNSHIYRLPITAEDVPNIYVSVVLIKGRADDTLADFKMGLLGLDVRLDPQTLTVAVQASTDQAEPGATVSYTVTVTGPDGRPVSGAELSLDVVDKGVLSLLPRTRDILTAFYARRALQVQTGSTLSLSVNRYMRDIAEQLVDEMQRTRSVEVEVEGVVMESVEFAAEAPMAAPPAADMMLDQDKALGGVALPPGVDVRAEFADTAHWSARLVTDDAGQAVVSFTLPDNLTTWVARAVGLDAQTRVGEGTAEVVATKPLLVRPVAPRFFVVDDRAQLAANVSNNTDAVLTVDVGLTAEGLAISGNTPALQTVTIPARSERKVTWWVRVADVTETDLIFSAVAEAHGYADASKPRLTTGPDGTLLVFRYTTPDIVGTAGQLTEGGSRTEAIALPPGFDQHRGGLTVRLEPSLAAAMQDGLRYLEHYEYESTVGTVSRFLPNLLTYRAFTDLGLEDAELTAQLPALVDEGLAKLYQQQNPDGGWGWWHTTENWRSNSHVSAYVVFGLLRAQAAGWDVRQDVLRSGLDYLSGELKEIGTYESTRDANHQAWLLYVLAEADQVPAGKLDQLFTHRGKLSHYARALLAQALWLDAPDDARLDTLLSDLNNAAILSATGAHWEETDYDWWAMNTDTRSTAIILNTYTKLDPENALVPNVVRWLMVARKGGIWETTQETAWALIALTDWMVHTGELDAAYDYAYFLNEEEQARGTATRETLREGIVDVIPIADLIADATNLLAIARTDGAGRLYYTAHLEVYQPVESVEPADRGFSVQRRYTLASCEEENRLDCPEVYEVQLGDVIRVDLTLITPHDRYYVMVEDALPAGGEAIDTGLATTSMLALDPSLRRTSITHGSDRWGWWDWWWNWFSRSELRDEKVVLFAEYLSAGTYEYSYTFRATLPGTFRVMPTVAQETYFPEVFGRSDGRLLTIGE